jgi:dTDP-glucose 4,6-dehydratase
MLVLAWNRTFGIKYIIVRPTNNYGIGQYVEKLIPKSIKYLTLGKKIDLHDRGNPVRTWLHADDTARAVITLIDQGSINEIYNISGNTEMPNRDVIKKILHHFPGNGAEDCWENYITDSQRRGQDVRYAIDDSKLKKLGWSPVACFDQELEQIVENYRNNFVW